MSARMLRAHYARLGLSPGATGAEVAAAYRAAALRCHPDRGGTAGEFAAVTESYEVVKRGGHGGDVASVRSYVRGRGGEGWGIVGAVVLPAVLGLAVGVRMVVGGGERDGLRAGGNSVFVVQRPIGGLKDIGAPGGHVRDEVPVGPAAPADDV